MDKSNIQKLIYSKLDFFLAMLLFIGCVCYLPMILGTNYSLMGMAILLLVIFIFVAIRHGKISAARKGMHLNTYISAMALFGYCLIQSIILQSDREKAAIQTCFLLMLAVTVFFVAFSNKKLTALFIKIIYTTLIFFCVSYVISVLLMTFVGWDVILVTSFDYGYFTDTNIYFPFTTTYGSMSFNNILFKRLLGFARESGIMQVFYIWAFFMADKFFDRVFIVRAIMVIGIVACLSTSGFIVFCVSLLIYLDFSKIFSRKTFVIVALAVLVVYILFYAQGTRIMDRASATIFDRTKAMEYGLNVFKEYPVFGGGFYDTLGDSSIQTGICAIASLGQIGIVGIGLWLLVFAFAFLESKDKKRFIYANAALFITAIFAQPMIFAPVMYWFLFVDYDGDKVVLLRRNSSVGRNLLRNTV